MFQIVPSRSWALKEPSFYFSFFSCLIWSLKIVIFFHISSRKIDWKHPLACQKEMVATTRAAAARRRNSSPNTTSEITGSPMAKIKKKKRCNKTKKVVDEREMLSTVLSSSQTSTQTLVLNDVLLSLSTVSVPSPMPYSSLDANFVDESNILPKSNISSSLDYLHPNNGEIDFVLQQYVSLARSSDKIDERENQLDDLDCSQSLDEKTTWATIIGDIQWCKTNRGNDRLCMAGYTYDFMSSSMKNNYRSFRCTRKDRGCRAVIYVLIDSNMYKGCNRAEHNHSSNPNEVKRLLVLAKIKERVFTEPTSITRIIEDEYVKEKLNKDEQQRLLLPKAQCEWQISTSTVFVLNGRFLWMIDIICFSSLYFSFQVL